jgi:hypothetical protein
MFFIFIKTNKQKIHENHYGRFESTDCESESLSKSAKQARVMEVSNLWSKTQPQKLELNIWKVPGIKPGICT